MEAQKPGVGGDDKKQVQPQVLKNMKSRPGTALMDHSDPKPFESKKLAAAPSASKAKKPGAPAAVSRQPVVVAKMGITRTESLAKPMHLKPCLQTTQLVSG